MFFSRLLLAIFLSIFGTAVFADYLNPTKASDCVLWRTGSTFSLARERYSQQWSACWDQKWSTNERSGMHGDTCAALPTGKMAACSQYNLKKCQLNAKVSRLINACQAKLSRYRLQETELKRRQEEFEAQQRARSEEERARALEASRRQNNEYVQFMQDSTRYAMGKERLGPDAQRILQMQSRAKLAGKLATNFPNTPVKLGMHYFGIKSPSSGSYFVSNYLTRAGTRFVLGANAAAFDRLQSSLSQFDDASGDGFGATNQSSIYNSTNPRPFATQIDASYDLYNELQDHISRVESTVYNLPLGNSSVVNTATGSLLTEIVKARASGEISSLSSALTDYASVVRQQALDELEENAEKSAPVSNLQAQRLAVLVVLEKEAERLAKIAREKARARAQRNAGSSTPRMSSARKCLTVSSTLNYYNRCNYDVECIRTGSNPESRTVVFWKRRGYGALGDDTGYVTNCWRRY